MCLCLGAQVERVRRAGGRADAPARAARLAAWTQATALEKGGALAWYGHNVPALPTPPVHSSIPPPSSPLSFPCPTRSVALFRPAAGPPRAPAQSWNATRVGPPAAVRPLASAVAVRVAIGRGSASRRRAQGGGHPALPHHQRQTRPAVARTLPARASRSGLPGRVQARVSTAGHPWRRTYRAVNHPACTSDQGPDVPQPPSQFQGVAD